MTKTLIIGGGISGCTAAVELAQSNNSVTLVESKNRIGGNVLDYCCKATKDCSQCSVCIAFTQFNEFYSNKNINLITGASVTSVTQTGGVQTARIVRSHPVIDHKNCISCNACVSACPEKCITRDQKGNFTQYTIDFSRCRIHQGKECTLCADACPTKAVECGPENSEMEVRYDQVVIATGHEPFDPKKKPRYGYGQLKNVMTGKEAEELLASRRSLGDGAEDVAFVQCVGSRDPHIGRNYCSSICCAYALRLARVLKYNEPESNITIYYIDIQNFDKTFTHLHNELIASGIRFVRGLPFTIEETNNGKLKLFIEDWKNNKTVAFHDRVVLSVGLGPSSSASTLTEMFHLKQDEFGFLESDDKDVYVCGTCHEPMNISDSIAGARAVAYEIGKSVLAKGSV
ncbi:MAG: CoB--CoM heterodisulfide reductase iron-sulfur subunit A family protein [Spirochaetales bacterium]|nr:CoB--CoM heterodisulfide reductase iron-sulfur subunit A family protein [Spirochaetales bacterium]